MTAACPACATAPLAEAVASPRAAQHLAIPDLKCVACIRTVEGALNALPGVAEARVNLTLKRVSVQSDLPDETLVACLKEAGFAAYPFGAEAAGGMDAVGRDLILRLGVAGFAMMNVMLLSVAVWSGATDATRDLFHLISAAIALPAALFSAQPFFRNAWSALRVARLNMDVPISLAILLAAGLSLFEALNGGAHAYFDAALSLTFFLLIGRVLEHRARAAARSAVAELSALEVQTARRRAGAGYETVPAAALAPGDELLVATGMRVPADGALQEEDALTDRSFLTGESDPVLSQRGATLRAGEINLGAPVHIRAEAVGEATNLRQIARLLETAERARTRYTSLADRAARVYAPVVHLLALATFLGWWAFGGDIRAAINIAVAVLIITCPCALGLAVPAVATTAIGLLFRRGFVIKSGTALERFAEADVILCDKTGTLTMPGGQVDVGALPDPARGIALALAQMSEHPVSHALAKALEGETPARLEAIREHPGQGIEGRAGDQIVRLGRADWVGGSGTGLALGIGPERYAIGHDQELRPGAAEMVRSLQDAGYDLRIVSGDTPARTAGLAAELGVAQWQAGMTPEEKFALVEALQARGHRVAMMGDGINDAAALAAAHASLAPGSALDATRSAADAVILAPSLASLPGLFRISRWSVRLSRQNFAISTLYNAVAIPVAVLGFASPMLAALAMSSSSITVLLNALRLRLIR